MDKTLKRYAENENVLESIETDAQALNTIKEIMKKYGISVNEILRKRDVAGVGKPSGFLSECNGEPAWKEHISEDFREEISILFQQQKFDKIRRRIWNKLAEEPKNRWCSTCASLLVDTLNVLNVGEVGE